MTAETTLVMLLSTEKLSVGTPCAADATADDGIRSDDFRPRNDVVDATANGKCSGSPGGRPSADGQQWTTEQYLIPSDPEKTLVMLGSTEKLLHLLVHRPLPM